MNTVQRTLSVLILVISLIISSCGTTQSTVSIEKAVFSGTLLFKTYSEENAINAYGISQGDSKPTLLWSLQTDLETSISKDISIISPKYTYGVIGGRYLLNLLNGEVRDLSQIFNNWNFYSDFEHQLAFSPDETYLAYIGVGGIQILNLKTNEVRELVQGKCHSYDTVFACLDMGHATWLDKNTLVFKNNKNIFLENYEFPGSIWASSDSDTAILEYADELSAIDLNGKVLFNVGSGDYYSYHGGKISQEGGDVILYDTYGMGDQIVWFSKSELLANQGMAEQHRIEKPLHALFNSPGKTEVLSPSGRYLLRFPSDIVNLEAGSVSDLNIIDRIQSLADKIEFNTCVWNLNEEQAVCQLTYFGGAEKDHHYLFVFLSTTGDPIAFAKMNITPVSSLLTWLP